MRFHATTSKALTTSFFKLRNSICHQLIHCTHTLNPFVPRLTPMGIIFASITSSAATGHITRKFLLSIQLAAIVQELACEDFRKSSNLTPAIPLGFEAIYSELQIVLEAKILPKGISFVLGIPTKSNSATHIVFQEEPL